MLIRPATADDADALAAIYGHHCLHGLGTFEEVAPSPGDMVERMEAVHARGLPYLVAEVDGTVAGFAYAGPFRPRAAYRYTVEDSVYLAPERTGQGIGKALLTRIVAECEALGLRQMVAVIGDSGNAASIGPHKSLGFTHQGVRGAFGQKFGHRVDIASRQAPRNASASAHPDTRGLDPQGS